MLVVPGVLPVLANAAVVRWFATPSRSTAPISPPFWRLRSSVTAAAIGLYRPEICIERRRLLINTSVAGLLAFPAVLVVSGSFHIGAIATCRALADQGSAGLAGLHPGQPPDLQPHHARTMVRAPDPGARLRARASCICVQWPASVVAGYSRRCWRRRMQRPTCQTRRCRPTPCADSASGASSSPTILRRQTLRNAADTEPAGLQAARRARVQRGRLLRTASRTHRSRQRHAPTGCCSPMGSPTARMSNAIKRALDICVSLRLLLLTLPLMLLTAALIRLDSPGPVLYRQHARRAAWRVVHAAQVPQHGDGRRGWRQAALGDAAGPAHHPRRQLHPPHAHR